MQSPGHGPVAPEPGNSNLRLVAGNGGTTPIALTMSVAEAFVVFASSIVEEAEQRARALDSHADPEVLHRLRVTLRRLRSLWWAYEPLLEQENARTQRSAFKSLANAAGRTRDWDVLGELLGNAVTTGGELSQSTISSLKRAVGEHRIEALSQSRTTLHTAGVERLLRHALADACRRLDSQAAGLSMAGFAEERVARAEKTLQKRVRQAAQSNHADHIAFHEVRIAGKKLRYLLEFFSPVLDGEHRETIRRLSDVQEELGRLNDVVVSERLVQQYASRLGDREIVGKAMRWLEKQQQHHIYAAQQMLQELR